MKKIFNILILGVMGLALSLPLVAFAIPAFPMNFDGTVFINGSKAPIGSVVEAYGDITGDVPDAGEVVLADFTLTEAGVYGGARILAESAKLSIPEYNGSSFTFKINSPSYDNNATLADTETYSSTFSDFTDVTQNLVFTGATPNSAITAITVTPTSASVAASGTQQFTATATYYDSTTADITTSCTWTSSSTTVATVGTNTGLATGANSSAGGTSTITASYTDAIYGALTDTASLTVAATSGGTAVAGGGGGGGSAPSVPTTTTGEVTASYSGGAKTTLTTADNTKVTVKFLPYAVSTGTKISVKAVSKTAAKVSDAVFAVISGKSIVGNYVYDFSAEKGGEAVTEFSKKATLTFTYTDAQIKGLKESSLKIAYWDADNEVWVELDTTVSEKYNKVTVKTLHFTYFAIIGEEGADAPVITRAYLREQIKNIIRQLIILITELIKVYQAQLIEMRTQ
jgi:hypothetical protein